MVRVLHRVLVTVLLMKVPAKGAAGGVYPWGRGGGRSPTFGRRAIIRDPGRARALWRAEARHGKGRVRACEAAKGDRRWRARGRMGRREESRAERCSLCSRGQGGGYVRCGVAKGAPNERTTEKRRPDIAKSTDSASIAHRRERGWGPLLATLACRSGDATRGSVRCSLASLRKATTALRL